MENNILILPIVGFLLGFIMVVVGCIGAIKTDKKTYHQMVIPGSLITIGSYFSLVLTAALI